MNSEKLRKRLWAEADKINDEGIKSFTQEALALVHESFFIVPSSSTGKYHPKREIDNGGLAYHTLTVLKVFEEFERNELLAGTMTSEEKDICRAAIILHDSCKNGRSFESKWTLHSHPLLVKDMVDIICKPEQFELIMKAIASHSGPWTQSLDKYGAPRPGEPTLPLPKSRVEKIVHLCDYVGSRSFIDMDLGDFSDV
jgi:hypothetical protein